MEENKIAINKYLSKNNTLCITKTKPNVINVRDGIITYCVTLNPLACQCNSSLLCAHTIYILNVTFKLDFNLMIFFHKLLPTFYLHIKDPSLNEILTQMLYDEILIDECGICIEKLHSNKKEIAECDQCKKYCHRTCLNKWIVANKKNNPDKKCVYCNTGTML